jgi:hypothetical protein
MYRLPREEREALSRIAEGLAGAEREQAESQRLVGKGRQTFVGDISEPATQLAFRGEAMTPPFQEGFYDAVSTYVRTRSADSFADDLEDAVAKDRIPQR